MKRKARVTNAGAGFGVAILCVSNAFGQTSGTPRETLEEIVVVGSSIGKSQDTVEKGALPIQLITNEELRMSGDATIQDFMRTEPAFFGGGSDTGSFGTASTLNLRGLGDQYTLTLLNGRRIAIDGPANVAAIPFESIERIEVLKAGASAIYGSDAVAGVVNIVTKRHADGAGVSIRYGDAADSYDERSLSAHFGAEGDKGGYFVSVSHREHGALLQRDRPGTFSNDQRSLGGFDFRSSFGLPAPIELPTGETVILNTDAFPVGTYSLDPADFRPYDRERDAWDRVDTGSTLIGENKSTSFIFSGDRKLTDDLRIVGDYLYDTSKDFSYPGGGTFALTVPAENFYNPFGVDVIARYRAQDVQPVFVEISRDTISGSLAAEYNVNDNFLLSLEGSLTSIDETNLASREYSIAGTEAAVARTTANAFNPFGNRANSAEQLQGIVVPNRNVFESNLATFDARLAGTAFTTAAGDIEMAIGANFRTEELEELPGPLQRSVGPSGNSGIYDSGAQEEFSGQRDVFAIFGELQIPLLKSNGGVDNPLELGLAARYEEYSDFGSTFDPLTSIRWAASPSTTLRVSYNTSFRAPTLRDLTPNSQVVEFNLIDPITSTPVDAAARIGGNPNLKPEEAETIAAGIVFTPQAIPGLFLSLDYYSLTQSDVILAPNPQSIFNGSIPGDVIFEDDIGPGGEDILIIANLTNVAKRRVSGLDLASRYSFELASSSTIDIDFSAHYLLEFDADVSDGQGFVSQEGTLGDFDGLPEFRGVASIGWNKGPANLVARLNHVSDMHDVFAPVDNYTVDSFTTLDLAFEYQLDDFGIQGGSVSTGVNNIFDTDIPYSPGSRGYARRIHDVRGMFWYASLSVRF